MLKITHTNKIGVDIFCGFLFNKYMKKNESHAKPSHDVMSPEVKKDAPQDNMLKNNWIPLAFIGVLAVLFVAIRLINGPTADLNNMKTKVLPDIIKKVVNNPSTKIEILSTKESNGLIEFELSVNGQKYTSYISKDGKLLFTSAIKVDDILKAQGANASTAKPATAAELKKSDKPSLTAFVVSNCPYGLQMQRAFKVAMAELPDLGSYLTVKYIGSVNGDKLSSMHGDQEAEENLRQICIREEQKDKYWPYVSCYMQAGNNDSCLGTAGVDTTQLNSCVSDKTRGIAYAQKDFAEATKFNVQGSPTLLANSAQTVSEYDFGGRNPNAIKDIVCALGTTKPSFCSQSLTKADVAVSLSTTDEGTAAPANTAAGGNANCAPAK